jgi:paraquat-inducible protein B
LEEPPVVHSGVPGREFVLSAQKIGSLGPGSPIYFRGIQVGEVTSEVFAGIDKGIEVRIFVREPYDALVYEGTRFWSASAISLSTRPGGFKVEVESVQALLSGGIAFDTLETERKGQPAAEGASFPLFDDRTQAQDASYTKSARLIVEFEGSVHGLEVGAPVEFRGMKVGRVLNFHLEFDPDGAKFRIPVTIEFEFERVQLASGSYDQYGGGRLLPVLVARGLRAQLRSASFITGQLMVALDFFPDAPPAEVTMSGSYPKLPAMPNELEGMTRSVGATLDKIAALPLDAVVQDLRDVLESVRELTANPDLKDTARSVNVLLASLRQASDSADATLKRANATLAGYGGDSKFQGDLRDMVRQLQETLRSVRLLANYLEQHPESLVRGKAAAAR